MNETAMTFKIGQEVRNSQGDLLKIGMHSDGDNYRAWNYEIEEWQSVKGANLKKI